MAKVSHQLGRSFRICFGLAVATYRAVPNNEHRARWW